MGPPIHLNLVHLAILLTALQLLKMAILWVVGALNADQSAPGRAVINVYSA